RSGFAAEIRGERVKEPSFGRLDRAPVHGHDGCAGLARIRGGGREQDGLAYASEAVDEQGKRRFLADEPQQNGALALAADNPARLPVEQRTERRFHGRGKSTQSR